MYISISLSLYVCVYIYIYIYIYMYQPRAHPGWKVPWGARASSFKGPWKWLLLLLLLLLVVVVIIKVPNLGVPVGKSEGS